MQFFKYIGLVFLVGSIFWCCKNNSQTEDATTTLRFEERTFSKQSSTCGGADTLRCATVEVTYPLATAGAPEAMRAINDSIQHYVRQTLLVGEGMPENMEKAADLFIQSYEDYIQQDSVFITPWEMQTNGKVIYQSPQYVSIEISNYSYAGGAHPNGYVNLFTFDAATGKKLTITDLVTDTAKLKELAEVKFRQARELSPDANLNEEGFFWDGPFALPANLAMTQQGLYLVYNAYEAAAYAAGPTEFTLSKEALQGILKKE